MGFWGRNTKFWLQGKRVRVIYQYFIGKGVICIKTWFYHFLCLFAPKTVFWGLGILVINNFWVEKSIFFDFSKMSSKCFLSMNMAWKHVLEALKAIFWPFLNCYGHMISLWKNSNFSKNAIFSIFWEFLKLVVLDAKKHKNYQK